MEVCGTHTTAIFKSGVREKLKGDIKLVSGPGCPVCVTEAEYIDSAIFYAKKGFSILTFGDLMKVRGNKGNSLSDIRAEGFDIRVFLSPLDAITLAKNENEKKFLILAVGFETTIPVYTLALEEILKKKITNIKFLFSLKRIAPAIEFIIKNEKDISAFIAPGHVAAIIGETPFIELSEKYEKPFVIAGFQGKMIMEAISNLIKMYKEKRNFFKNDYKKIVSNHGNEKALSLIKKYFTISSTQWREIGLIKDSAFILKKKYAKYQLPILYNIGKNNQSQSKGCLCKGVILGRILPIDCPLFQNNICNPENPIGPCMVSSEGACRIFS
jgi:hydrogenase expression/formation protein HypD